MEEEKKKEEEKRELEEEEIFEKPVGPLDIDKEDALEEEVDEESENPKEKKLEEEPEKLEEEEKLEKLEETIKIETPKPPKKGRKGFKFYLLIFVVLLLIFGTGTGIYFWQKSVGDKQRLESDKQLQEIQNEINSLKGGDTKKETKESETASNVVYVNAKEGLRLRKEASQTADILETMPYGTKLEILEEKSGWIKTTYNSKTGWCMKEYTQASKPAELNIRDVDFKGLIYDYFINEKKLAKEIVNTSFTVATEFGDLTGDKREDALAVATQSGTGVCQTTFVYSYKNGYILNRLLVKDPPTTCHNTVKLVGTDIVEDYAVYNPGDANCCPTGGRKKDYYKWDGDEFTKYKETPYAG